MLKNEVYQKVKDYSKHKNDLQTYYKVGRLLVEAQGGAEKSKYGDNLIKEYSEKLTKELGKGYKASNLKNMRQFYLIFRNRQALPGDLSWSHCIELIRLRDITQIDYYIKITSEQHLSYRELHSKIKSKEYERIGYKDELSKPNVNSLIKEPIVLKVDRMPGKLTEYALHRLIEENMGSFLKELGVGFSYIDSEVKIKIGDVNHRMDMLLYNYKFNCFVVIELKVTPFKTEYIGQVKKYINYVDEHIKDSFNNRTVGVIICKEADKYVLSYCTDERIFTTTYRLQT